MINNTTGHVFVYGTLKVGGFYAEAFDTVRLSSKPAYIEGALLDLHDFPGIKTCLGGRVHGEIHEYEQFDQVINAMDQIEGYYGPGNKYNLFERIQVVATDENEEKKEVIAYEFGQDLPDEKERVIKSGIWKI